MTLETGLLRSLFSLHIKQETIGFYSHGCAAFALSLLSGEGRREDEPFSNLVIPD
jgi:hypothetical protein